MLERGGFEHLCLPAEYEPTHPFRWPDDPRTGSGEVLWHKWNRQWLEEKKLELAVSRLREVSSVSLGLVLQLVPRLLRFSTRLLQRKAKVWSLRVGALGAGVPL